MEHAEIDLEDLVWGMYPRRPEFLVSFSRYSLEKFWRPRHDVMLLPNLLVRRQSAQKLITVAERHC